MKIAAVVLLLAVPAAAQSPPPPSASPSPAAAAGVVSGRVLTHEGQPVAAAHVELIELARRAETDAAGQFRFEEVPPGAYILQAQSGRSGLSITRVEVAPGGVMAVELVLDRALHSETVVVTAMPGAATLSDVAQPVTVLAGSDLTARLQPTLGETLAQQPGVSSTYFGPGSSRPVIRGLGGDRMRVLQSGVGTADASNTSPDHAVSFDPLSAEQIEVVRGPATLLYGSNAVGGVVNVLDDRVPDTVPDRPLHGKAELSAATAADDRAGAVALTGGTRAFAFHADISRRSTGDVAIPGFAESAALRREEGAEDEEHEQVAGVLENSAVTNTSGAVGASWVGGRGFIGLALSGLDSLYGVPGHAHHAEDEGEAPPAEEESPVRIDLRQRRADVRGELRQPFAGARNVRLRFGLADYTHTELEGDETGTIFSNESWEGRLELNHAALGPFTGALGLQASRRDFEAVGAEAFVPPSVTDSFAVFAFEEARTGSWRFQAGGRLERQEVEAAAEAPIRRAYTGASASGGVAWQPTEAWSAAFTLARSVKLPNAEELFSNGPHLATRAFEIGDPDLGKEHSLGLDLSLRRRTGRVTGELNLFVNRFDGFIFEELSGELEDGLQVARYVQRDAEFRGMEVQVRVDLFHAEPHHVDLDLMADYVRAELRDTGEPLPRIPPLRYGTALHYDNGRWNARMEVRGVASQRRVAAFERPTEGYAMLNASLDWRLFAGRSVVELLLRGSNLTDEEARNHVSFLKDLAPLPGRDLRLAVRVAF